MAVLTERDHIGIFGRMNAGKSSIINLLTQQETSIVDSTPGTTADTKIALQEIHGIGPVKLFDTAGIDETNILGDKKRKRALSDLKECDLILLVINPAKSNFSAEKKIINQVIEHNKQILIIYNLFNSEDKNNLNKIEKEISAIKYCKKINLSAIDEKFRQPLIDFIIQNFESKNQKIPLLPFLVKNDYYILVNTYR